MTWRAGLLLTVLVLVFALATWLSGPPSCADLRGLADCPAVSR